MLPTIGRTIKTSALPYGFSAIIVNLNRVRPANAMTTSKIDYSRYQCLKIEKAGKLATVTLNQPETGNRIEHRFHVELQDIWADLARDPDVNVILLTGSGNYFSVGGNVRSEEPRLNSSHG